MLPSNQPSLGNALETLGVLRNQISPDALILHQNCLFFLPYRKVVHDAVKGSGSSDTQ